jgi:hypothetical protein
MYALPVEELAWALAREREEEARQARPPTPERPARPLSARLRIRNVIRITSELARLVYHKRSDEPAIPNGRQA